MIKVTGHLQKAVQYSVVYNPSIKTINIEASYIVDDCMPYRESTGCMVWMDNNHIPCEIECIFPIETGNLGSWKSQDVTYLKATPKLDVSFEEKPVEVFFNDVHLILIFNKNRKADRKYISSNIDFYVSDDELIALECKDFNLI